MDKNKDIQQEALTNLAQKSELEQTLAVALNGPPQIKAEEKLQYLGQFRERVIRMLTKRQVIESRVFPEIKDALNDHRAAHLYIHGEISFSHRNKYQKIASQLGKPFTVIHDPSLKGDVGLIVASDTAVDIEHISVEKQS